MPRAMCVSAAALNGILVLFLLVILSQYTVYHAFLFRLIVFAILQISKFVTTSPSACFLPALEILLI